MKREWSISDANIDIAGFCGNGQQSAWGKLPGTEGSETYRTKPVFSFNIMCYSSCSDQPARVSLGSPLCLSEPWAPMTLPDRLIPMIDKCFFNKIFKAICLTCQQLWLIGVTATIRCKQRPWVALADHETEQYLPPHMDTVRSPEPSNRPLLRFIWSEAVSSGSSCHNSPVSRLAVIASPALHSKQRPLSVSYTDAGPFHQTLACANWAECIFVGT